MWCWALPCKATNNPNMPNNHHLFIPQAFLSKTVLSERKLHYLSKKSKLLKRKMQFRQIYVHAYLYLGLSLYCIIRFKAASNWKNKQYSSKGYLRRKLTTLMNKNSFITWNCKFHALKQAVSHRETNASLKGNINMDAKFFIRARESR